MGNSSSKDKASRPGSIRHASEPTSPTAAADRGQQLQQLQQQQTPGDRLVSHIYGQRNGGGRSSRPDLSFLHIGRDRNDEQQASDRPRETRQEREARRAERERQARLKERERSMREEGVDGGYLVTLGTYTGSEDFNKDVVRQLQIERRVAPFWKGLNDHSDAWTEYQLVAAARGLPIPAPDEIPPEMARSASQASTNPGAADANISSLTVPISQRSQSYQSDSTNLSASHPAFSSSGPSSPTNATSAGQLFRGRAKTLASLATGNKSQSPDMTPQEIRLPHEPNVNGQPLEAFLYKDAAECPICFMYYPPYLNRTRCCDQSICSECFVQIKRPDPHPPEHEQPGQPRPPEEEADLLVSEVAACPFCVTPEFGVSYEPPPFRRGLAYTNQANSLKKATSAMSSSTSLASGTQTGRRRGASLSASAPNVTTTDRVRPDWAKKLADARAHALRRSAAATALHNAAYVLGGQDSQSLGALGGFGRRRRTLFRDSPSASGSGTPQGGSSSALATLADYRESRANENGNRDVASNRRGSRRNRVEDLEDLMMMEAIRLSLAAEEDRKRKEEKEAKKDAKKRAKDEKKEAKQAEKAARRGGNGSGMYRAGTNESSSSWASTNMARSTSNLGMQPSIPEEQVEGKGKAPAQDFAGFKPLSEPTSTLNTEMKDRGSSEGQSSSSPQRPASSVEDPQRHLESSRANILPVASSPIPTPGLGSHQRQISNVSSAASSFIESGPGSLNANSHGGSANPSTNDLSQSAYDASSTPPTGGAGLEPMFNFRSLTAIINADDKGRDGEHIEHVGADDHHHATSKAEEDLKEPSPSGSPRSGSFVHGEGNRSRGDSAESSASNASNATSNTTSSSSAAAAAAAAAPPPVYVEGPTPTQERPNGDLIEPAPHPVVRDVDVDVAMHDKKGYGGINVLDHGHTHAATQ